MLTETILNLIDAIKGNASIAVIVFAAIQVLKTNEVVGIIGKLGLQGNAVRVVVAVLTSGGYVAQAMMKGLSIWPALVEGLFTAGGAMLIFEAIKKINDK